MTSPLAGKRVVNTRAAHQAAELDRLLRDRGAVPLSFPCIAIRPPTDVAPLDAALGRLADGGFDWVVFTSANTVEAVAGRLSASASTATGRSGVRDPAEGSPTAASLGDQPSGHGEPDVPIYNPRPSGGPDSPASGHADPSTCHPERSEGSWRSPSTGSGEPHALLDQPGTRAREPAKGSPRGTVGVGEPADGGGIANLRPPASQRWHDLGPGGQPLRRPTAPAPPSPSSVAVVGPATAEAVARLLGWPVDVRPEVETAAELGRAMPVAPGDRVLLPKSALAGPALAAILTGHGAEVTEVVAYEVTTGAGGVDLASLLAAGEVDAVCFTSGSTVRGCLDRLGGAAIPASVRVACVGTETAAVAASLGLRVDAVPAEHTARAMVEALAASFATDDG